MRRGFSVLLVVHGVFTFVAGMAIAAAPGYFLPASAGATGISSDPRAVVAYQLAALEFGVRNHLTAGKPPAEPSGAACHRVELPRISWRSIDPGTHPLL